MKHRKTLLSYGLAIGLLVMSAYAASASEIELAGVRLGRSALLVIQKYGNPSEVRVGAARAEEQQMSAATGMPMTGAIDPELVSQMNQGGGLGGGLAALFGTSPTPTPMLPMGQQAPQKMAPPEVTWVYKFPKNKTLEFIINPDGRILQIAAYGVDWSSIRTSRGITLGDTYRDVVLKYGFPESHEKSGLQLMAKYPDKHRAVFTLVGKTVVGITIALMD